MNDLKVMFNKESLEHNPRTGRFYGDIWVEADGLCYPGENWNDFILTVLETWVYNLLHRDSGTLCFFDGPYEIGFHKNENVLELRVEDEGLGTYYCEEQYFLQTLREYLLQICDIEKYSQVLEKEKLMIYVKEIDNYIMRNYKKSTDK